MVGHDEREQTLNQLLVQMDGFDTAKGVIIMAATNRPEILDPALLRPGRFDRHVALDRPDLNGREKILNVHAKQITLAPQVDLRAIAVEDLADPGNMMPQALRAQIISIGIWILKELERVRAGEVGSFTDVIVVSKAIRDGLP